MKAKEFAGCLLMIVWFGIGLVQCYAIAAGLAVWLGIPFVLALVLMIPLAYIPLLGAILAILGAIHGLGWSPLFAIMFFFWPFVLMLILLPFSTGYDAIQRWRAKRNILTSPGL